MTIQGAPTEAETHHLVVIGASAGGVETLVRVVSGLPADLRASVCIVLHIAPGSPSALPSILRRAGRLPCRSAVDGELLRDGEILVAPPDRHLAVTDGRVALTVAPRENGHRPAVDVLFRSAAQAQDGRVIGVVLSGTRDDGTAGLAVIKACGGMAIIQDPAEALYPGMPASALAHVAADVVVPSERVADAIVRLVAGAPASDPPAPDPPDPPPPDPPDPPGLARPGIAAAQAAVHDPIAGGADPEADEGHPASAGEPPGSQPVTSTCPECGGVLAEQGVAGVTQWRCRVGHRYSPESLADAQAEGVEGALWAAVRALDDRQALLERMAATLATRGHVQSARSFRNRARQAGEQAGLVRSALTESAGTSLQSVADSEAVDDERRSFGHEPAATADAVSDLRRQG